MDKTRYIELGPFVTTFLKDYEIDSEFVDQMCEVAGDYYLLQFDAVKDVYIPIEIVEWDETGAKIKPRSAFSLFSAKRGKADLAERVLARLYDLNADYIEKFTEVITDTLVEAYTDGDD